MKYTLKLLHSKTNDELNEIVAQAQGWTTSRDDEDEFWSDASGAITYDIYGYSPTSPTVEGKAQAFDLIIKYELEFSSKFKDEYRVYSLTDDSMYTDDKNPQRSIVIASILYMQSRKGKQNETS